MTSDAQCFSYGVTKGIISFKVPLSFVDPSGLEDI